MFELVLDCYEDHVELQNRANGKQGDGNDKGRHLELVIRKLSGIVLSSSVVFHQ